MHMHTYNVRKPIESNALSNARSYLINENGQLVGKNNNSGVDSGPAHNANTLLGDNCTYCYKPFKDFKSEFNKRVYVKCCKIKRHLINALVASVVVVTVEVSA